MKTMPANKSGRASCRYGSPLNAERQFESFSALRRPCRRPPLTSVFGYYAHHQ